MYIFFFSFSLQKFELTKNSRTKFLLSFSFTFILHDKEFFFFYRLYFLFSKGPILFPFPDLYFLVQQINYHKRKKLSTSPQSSIFNPLFAPFCYNADVGFKVKLLLDRPQDAVRCSRATHRNVGVAANLGGISPPRVTSQKADLDQYGTLGSRQR